MGKKSNEKRLISNNELAQQFHEAGITDVKLAFDYPAESNDRPSSLSVIIPLDLFISAFRRHDTDYELGSRPTPNDDFYDDFERKLNHYKITGGRFFEENEKYFISIVLPVVKHLLANEEPIDNAT